MKPRGAMIAATLTAASVGCVLFSAWSTKPDAESSLGTPALAPGPIRPPASSPGMAASTNAYFDGSHFGLALADWRPDSQFASAKTETLDFIQSTSGATFGGVVSGGSPSGWGVFNQPNGTRLEGEWHDGVPYRISGRVFLPDGIVEEGTWDYVKGTGHGTITWRDGRTYQGDWKIAAGDYPELPEGVGAMTWADGHKYVGHFYNGQMHGWGTMTQTDGKIVDGLWQRGDFMMSRISR